jgi:hypothetical protein
LGAQGAPTTTTEATADFTERAFGGESGVSGAAMVPMRAPSPSFLWSNVWYERFWTSRKNMVAATTTTSDPSGVAVGGVLTGGVSSTRKSN